MRRLITLVTVLAAALLGSAAAAVPAQAKVPGPNGQIVFGRFNTGLGDFQIFTANPDGTSQVQLLPGVAECPRWSPNGTRILVCTANPGGLIRPATVKPDGSGFTLLDNPDPTLNLACWAWSPKVPGWAARDGTMSNPAGRGLHRALVRRRWPGPRHSQPLRRSRHPWRLCARRQHDRASSGTTIPAPKQVPCSW